MAISTKTEKYVALTYAKYFGKTADKGTIEYYGSIGKTSKILNQIIKDADIEQYKVHGDDLQAEVHNTFQNLFSRNADNKELQKYVKVLEKGKNLPINSIVKKATKFDKDVYNNKQEIAKFVAEKGGAEIDLSKVTKANPIDVKSLTSLTDLQAKIDALPENITGEIYTLTAGVDMGSAFEGTEKGDVFNSFDITNPSTNTNLRTLNSFDTLDGKEGNDILNIQTGFAIANPTLNLTSIETVNVRSAADVVLDGSKWEGTNTLNVTQATNVAGTVAANLTAAATTDVNVSGVTAAIVVSGGKNVVVNDSTTNEAITVGKTGATTTNAAGTITVTDTDNSGATNVITVNGGTDVTVTATATATNGIINVGSVANGTATGDVKVTQNLNSDGVVATITGAAINVVGGKTVDVTVNANSTAKAFNSNNGITTGKITVTADDNTKNVTVTQNAKVATVTKPAVAEVKDSQTVTFKDLAAGKTVTVNGLVFTAEKDLTAAEVAKAFANLTATDTQSEGGITSNGIYTAAAGTVANWTSGAANGATVTFTAPATTGEFAVNSNDAASIPTKVYTAGTGSAGATTSSNAVTLDDVDVDDNATKSIENITVKGADDVTLGSNTAAKSLDALKTLSLANVVGATNLNTTATALNLTVNDVATATNTAVVVNLDVTAATIKDLTLKSTGDESKLTLAAAAVKNLTVDAAAALNVSGGTMMSTVAGLENITVKGTAAVTLGTVASTALKSFDASANTGGVTATINASNAASHTDLTTFVFSGGKDVVTLDNAAINKNINLGAGDDSITLAAGITAITKVIDGGTGSNTIAMTALQAHTATADDVFEGKITNFQKLSIGATLAATVINLANMDDISYVTTAGTGTAVNTNTLTLNDMANNGTVVLTAVNGATAGIVVNVKDAATNLTDVLNISLDSAASLTGGLFTVANVETINIDSVDTEVAATPTKNVNTITVDADKATTVNVDGGNDLTLTLTALSSKVTMIDGSSMTGGLTATTVNSAAKATIKGGSGNDNLTANNDNDVLIGGAGSDTLIVTSGNLVQLHGGAGKDTYQFGASSNQNAYATINGTKAELSGDIIKFSTALTSFNDAKIVLGSTAVFQDYVNEAAKGGATNGVSYFTWAGDTYLVQDNNASATFSNGNDVIVKITGTVDFTFNDSATKVLEIA